MRNSDVIPFLRTIHDRPADDLPRLVFADFLDEQGDWRGPLLRRPAPPMPLRDRAATAAWHARLGNLHGVQWVGCRRGLLSVLMPAAAVYELPDSHLLKEAFRQGWVEHLDLIDNAGIPWADQLELQELPRLGFQSVDDETLEHLPPLPALRELYLNNCRATRAELEWLNDFPRLQSVHVGLEWDVTDADLARLERVPCLESLTVFGHHLTNTALEQIGRLRGLRKMNAVITDATDMGLSALLPLERLEELRLDALRITDEALVFFARLPGLRALDLSGNRRQFSYAAVTRFRTARPDVQLRW